MKLNIQLFASASDWIKEAEAYAKQYADSLKTSQQYLIDNQNTAKQSAISALSNENQSAINKLNSSKTGINATALDNAKQANINKMLSLRDNAQSLNRAGLGTQGIVGSQTNSINNNYNSNLNTILKEKASNLANVDSQIADTNLQYNTNKVNTENQYATAIANAKNAIEESALNQYNTMYSSYLNQKQQEYDNQQAEIARQEAIRQFNANLAAQYAQIAASKEKSYDFGDSGTSVYKSNYSPSLSSGAANVYVAKNISNQVIKNGGISESALQTALSNGLSSGTLSQSDVDKVLKSFGL